MANPPSSPLPFLLASLIVCGRGHRFERSASRPGVVSNPADNRALLTTAVLPSWKPSSSSIVGHRGYQNAAAERHYPGSDPLWQFNQVGGCRSEYQG